MNKIKELLLKLIIYIHVNWKINFSGRKEERPLA